MANDDTPLPLSRDAHITLPPVKVAPVEALNTPLPLSFSAAEAYIQPVIDGRLEDLGVVATGACGRIHRVFDHTLLRHVAMKTLDAQVAQSGALAQRFFEEAQITGQLDHPNIVPVHEVGQDDAGNYYFTMKLVRGRTLGQVLREDLDFADSSRRDLARVLEIFLKVCDAVSFAHSRGVIHRDLKPDNIMVGSHGQVYVMDWGIAHLEDARVGDPDAVRTSRPEEEEDRDGLISGTLSYMSPEQARGEPASFGPPTDVFSLGAILYEILTGRPPYREKSLILEFRAAIEARIEPPEALAAARGMPAALCQVAMRALALDPAERYQSVGALSAEVERVLRGGQWFSVTRYAAGELVLLEGDRGDQAFIVEAGELEVFTDAGGHEELLQTLGPGAVFGEVAILADVPRTASVRAITAVTLLVVTRASLEVELGDHQRIRTFLQALADRFASAARRATELREDAEAARVRGAIMAHLLSHGRVTEDGIEAPWLGVLGAAGLSEGQVLQALDGTLTLSHETGVLRWRRG